MPHLISIIIIITTTDTTTSGDEVSIKIYLTFAYERGFLLKRFIKKNFTESVYIPEILVIFHFSEVICLLHMHFSLVAVKLWSGF